MTDAATPPQNLDAEQSVLGAMMVSEATIDPVLTGVRLEAEDFYRDKHRAIFEAITALKYAAQPVDVLTVAAALENNGRLEQVGGKDAIASLAATVPAPGSARHYAQLVKDNALLRRVGSAAAEIRAAVSERTQEPVQVVEHAVSTLLGAISVEREAGGPTEPDALRTWYRGHLNSDDPVDVFSLPWNPLNGYCGGGLLRTQTTTLTGITSEGKSTVLDQALEAFSAEGYRVGLHGTEMSREERMARWASKSTGVPLHRMLTKRMNASERAKVDGFLDKHQPPWRFQDAEGWAIEQICMDVIAAQLDVVAIDPINLIAGANDRQNMDRIAYELKALAKRANCHVIAVAHLRKIPTDRNGKPRRPTLDDIRESSMIAANSTNVLLLHRDRTPDNHGGFSVKPSGWLGWLKARNGIRDKGIRVGLVPGQYRFDRETRPGQQEMELKDKQPESAATGERMRTPEPEEVF